MEKELLPLLGFVGSSFFHLRLLPYCEGRVNFSSLESTVVQRSDVYPAGQSVRQNIVYFLEHRKKHGSLFHYMYILPDDPSGRVRKNVRSRPAKYI
jgi:hypothetical protein